MVDKDRQLLQLFEITIIKLLSLVCVMVKQNIQDCKCIASCNRTAGGCSWKRDNYVCAFSVLTTYFFVKTIQWRREVFAVEKCQRTSTFFDSFVASDSGGSSDSADTKHLVNRIFTQSWPPERMSFKVQLSQTTVCSCFDMRKVKYTIHLSSSKL